MSSNETNASLDAMSAAVRAATKLTNDNEGSQALTPAMLASAIKLAALPTSHQEQLTSATVNAAIKLAKQTPTQHESLTPESLATALKLAAKTSSNDSAPGVATADQMLAAMKAAVAMTHEDQTHELVTSELLSDALKLAKEE